MGGTPRSGILSQNLRTYEAILENQRSRVYKSNMILIAAILLLFAFYIFETNEIASTRYRLNVLHSGLLKENLRLESINSGGQTDINDLVSFAKRNGMIEAKNFESFFQDTGVASLR